MSDVPASELSVVNRRKRLAAAFDSVFGQTNRRSSDQRIVLEHLRQMCGRDSAIFQQDKEGRFDPLRAAQIDGAQTQYLIIKRQLELHRNNAQKKPETNIKK